jgi:hypothetical protein
MLIHNEGLPLENPLDREIASAIKLGLREPHEDFTRDLMSRVAEEEALPLHTESPGHLPLTLIALGFAFLVIAFLLPGSNTATSGIIGSGTLWTIVALGLIGLLALVESRPRFR